MSTKVMNKNWRRINIVLALGVVVGVLAWIAMPSSNSGIGDASQGDGCGAAYDSPSSGLAEDIFAWATTPEASDVFNALHERIAESPDFLDVRVHYVTQTILVVVTPGIGVPRETSDGIEQLVKTINAEVVFVDGCVGAADLEVAADSARAAMAKVVTEGDFRKFGGVAVSIDRAKGRVVLEADPMIGKRIVEAMDAGAELVDLVEGPAPGFTSRASDSPPFSGGAGYTTYSAGVSVGSCTTGFGSRYSYYGGFDVMATAAHCGVGGSVPMGAYNSGWQVGLFYVNGSFSSYVHPGPPSTYGRDVAMLFNPSVSYSNRLYSDPGTSPRYVVSYGDAYAGTPVCTNGRNTLSSCYNLPYDYNATLCALSSAWSAVKCVWVVRFVPYGGAVVVGGDSGGTVYQPTGGNGARVSGTISGSGYGSLFVTPVSFFMADGVSPKT